MKRIGELIVKIVLPLTIILFAIVTKWKYVNVEDGPEDFLYGFPLVFICSGWHTSMSLQIFISELLFDFFIYFGICLTTLLLIDKYIKQIIVAKLVKVTLNGVAIIAIVVYSLIFSNPNNIFYLKREFRYTEIRSGFKLIWQRDKR